MDEQNKTSVVAMSAAPAASACSGAQPAQDRRRGDRRNDRRDVVDRRSGLDRRRGPGVRRSEDRRAAEEGQMTDEQFEFLQAITVYKRVNRRPFPSWSEVLDVMKALGYRKVAPPQDIR
jgi:hypothetical protein